MLLVVMKHVIWNIVPLYIATECSVAEIVFPSGALITIIPFNVAAFMSMLSTPTPARATTLRCEADSNTLAVTCVWLRTIRASINHFTIHFLIN